METMEEHNNAVHTVIEVRPKLALSQKTIQIDIVESFTDLSSNF